MALQTQAQLVRVLHATQQCELGPFALGATLVALHRSKRRLIAKPVIVPFTVPSELVALLGYINGMVITMC